jgi:cyclophilin family peptidyl-prolyl cis-trans isomerase/HEAT repeat protein
MSWILRLEDQRVLRDPTPEVPPPVVVAPGQRAPVPAASPPVPDLVRMLSDSQARIRRRATLAVGRVGVPEGVTPLLPLLSDPDPEVRQMSAFALGLIGDLRARDALVAALNDAAPIVKGSAAEALGMIGDASAADAIARMAAGVVESGVLDATPPAEADARRDTPQAAFRLAIYALVRLKSFEPFAGVVLDPKGEPRVRWWPVAYALQALEDRRGLTALLALSRDPNPYTRALAAKGLGALNDRAAIPVLITLLNGPDALVAIEAIRAVSRIGDPAASPALIRMASSPKTPAQLRLEAVTALGGLGGDGVFDALLDAVSDRSPAIRAAALRGVARKDPEGFVTVLSGLDPDPQWTVRSALASVLATLPPALGLPRLRLMLKDDDQRVIPSVLTALTTLAPAEAPAILVQHLKVDDPTVRAAAATGLGRIRSPEGAAALADAYRSGRRDGSFVARAAALTALANYGATARPVLEEALKDTDWAVRLKAASLLKALDPTTDADQRIRPAIPADGARYQDPELVSPSVSTQAYLDTDHGTIQIELAVLDAPQTVRNFVTLARKGFFDGLTFHRVVPDFVAQTGDPRGDSEGGPGYTIRDELNQHPFLRGTVGMALDWEDTGGSQFFIAQSPQPQLDARYTVFARVVDGMQVLDQIEEWDVLRRVRIWDGNVSQ